MVVFNQSNDKRLIRLFDGLGLYQVGRNDLAEYSKFVFQIYNRHYLKKYQWVSKKEELLAMQQSDQEQFGDSIYFAFQNFKKDYIGTIKATKRQPNLQFPIEYEFNINVDTLCQERNLEVNEVWHLGRLAIDSEALKHQETALTSRLILRLLLHYSLSVINQKPNSLMIAESDVLIYDLFHELGINMQKVGAVKDCLGSPTYPVMVTGADIQYWLEQNPVDQILDEVLVECI